MLSFGDLHIAVMSFVLACGAAVPLQRRGYIRPFIQFQAMFSPCQINSHPLGQCCVRVLRCERRVWVKSTNTSNVHGSLQLTPLRVLQRAPLPPSLSPTAGLAAADCSTDRTSPLTYSPNRNICCLSLMILSIWERSNSYVYVLFHPGCC